MSRTQVVCSKCVALVDRFGEAESILLSLVGKLRCIAFLVGCQGELSHTIVQCGESDGGLSILGSQLSAYLYSLSIVTYRFEGYAAGCAHYESSSFGIEGYGECLALFHLGALHIVGIIPSAHCRGAIVALLFGGFVYGEHTGEHASIGKIEHRACIGSHFVESAWKSGHSAQGTGLLGRHIYQRQ